MPDLDDAVQFIKGVGPRRAEDFARLGVRTARDLLYAFPRRLSDRTGFVTVEEARRAVGETVSLRVEAIESRSRPVRGRRQLVTVLFEDATGCIEGVWFNAPWVLDRFEGETVLLYGKVTERGGHPQMVHPRVEYVRGDAAAGETIGRVAPVYPETGGLNQNAWRRIVQAALDTHLPLLPELYPEAHRRARDLMERRAAVAAMHFPADEAEAARARERLVYDECMLLQLAIARRRREEVDAVEGTGLRVDDRVDRRIRRLLPFALTDAQERALGEILADMARPTPMNRLLQGDVGSGKTAVAFYAALAAVANGRQAAVMAPTELLARQHAATFAAFLERSERSRVRVGLLVGGMRKGEREALLAGVRGGAVDIVIGTHAAIQKDVAFRDLAFVVIDEQHRFGVRQRSVLREKGRRPDVLVMTATPIPRSLALTLYGDLDVSTIDALPPGRKPVKTAAPPPEKTPKVYDFLRRELTRGRQAYIVCPLVEDNPDLELRSATEEYERLRTGELKGYRLGLLHGRMKRPEQQEVMDAFRAGRLDALVSTVVIEVGVDVPNATLLVVMHAERFGLAQLHQLRGRVARGVEQGWCVLQSDAKSPASRERLETLVGETDGFRIAEADLRLRGEGEFLGTRQHGHALELASIVDDFAVLQQTRADARALLDADPGLDGPPHRALAEELARFVAERGGDRGGD